MSHFLVAIDGPAGSGKSSVSKQVARELGFGYLDTGAAYRALAWAAQNLPGFELEKLDNKDLAADFDYSISLDPDQYWVRVGDKDLTKAIRSKEVAEFVSSIAQIQSVRNYMKSMTRDLIARTSLPGVVIEGRDITTVVAPDAEIKILLTASEEVRLRRRSAELLEGTVASVKRQVLERDASDLRVVDFMTPAAGVQLLDSSDLNFEQTVSAVVSLIGQFGSTKEPKL